MRKFLYSSFIAAIFLLVNNLTFAQGSFTLYTSSDGSPIIEGYGDCDSIFKYPQVTGLTGPAQLIINWGDGSTETYTMTPSGAGIAILGVNYHYSLPGTYTVSFELQALDGTVLDTHTESIAAFCNRVYGMIYKRNDGNCTYDAGVDDVQFMSHKIEVKKGGVAIDTIETVPGFGFHYTDPSPSFGVVYELNLLDNGFGVNQVCGPIAYMLDTLSGVGSNMHIAYDCSGTDFDNMVSLFGVYRTVDTTRLTINATHVTCSGSGSAIVTLHTSPKYSFHSASITPTSISGSVITWNLTSFDNEFIDLKFLPVGTLVAEDTAEFIAQISPVTGDLDATNNEFVLNQEIISAFDPNNKLANPAQYFATGDDIIYTINFENLGNDTAFNIHILDTLSSNVIPSTLQIIEASHYVEMYQKTSGGSTVVKFDFPNIRLADIDHPESNKGYVRYKITTNSGLPVGSQVLNTAHIYFDVNPAVVTNTTVNSIPTPSSLPNAADVLKMNVYPNPTKDKLFIQLPEGQYENLYIVNTLGQVIDNRKVENTHQIIDVSQYSGGVYYIVIEHNGQRYAHKFTKH